MWTFIIRMGSRASISVDHVGAWRGCVTCGCGSGLDSCQCRAHLHVGSVTLAHLQHCESTIVHICTRVRLARLHLIYLYILCHICGKDRLYPTIITCEVTIMNQLPSVAAKSYHPRYRRSLFLIVCL